MIWQLLAVVVAVVIGAAVAREFRGLWYLYGCGVLAIALQWLPWSRWLVGALVVLAIVVLLKRRGARVRTPALHSVDLLTVAVLAVFAAFSTIRSLWEWDAWAIWALKARVFIEHGGVDWAFLESASNDFAHPDYPLLVPVSLGLPAILGGGWDDRWAGVVGVAMLVAATVAIREITSREFRPVVSAAIALAVAALGASRYVGTAETPFIAYSVCALAFLRAGEWRHASLLLGFAALAKNEGLALLVIAALFFARHVWPAFLIAASWLIARALHHLPTDVATGPILERAAAHLSETPAILSMLAQNTALPWLWIALIAASPFAIPRERRLFAIIALQLVLAVAVYFVTPHDVAWHISNSWDRVSRQLLALTAFAVMIGIARRHSERSEESGRAGWLDTVPPTPPDSSLRSE